MGSGGVKGENGGGIKEADHSHQGRVLVLLVLCGE
jgi:hypothetical protein